MIFGHKNDIEKLLPYVSEDLRKALEYLAATDFSKVADGRYVLDGEKMYANVENYTTADRTQQIYRCAVPWQRNGKDLFCAAHC